MIPYGRQDLTEDDIAAVVAACRSDYLTQGPIVGHFEAAVAAYCGVDHAVAVNSATSALHIACMALGLGPGDWLWTSPITFVASANCALYCGARVDFVDIDPRTYNISMAALEDKLQQAERDGRLPKVVVPVHFCGEPCDMATVGRLSKRYGFKVIEDASHAIGARYQDRPVGSCVYSDITVFSFHPVKIITSGEGGMALTADPELASRMLALRSHGITRDPQAMTQPPDGPWFYQQQVLGFNYRMTDIQAALGLSQFNRLDAYVARRHVLAEFYDVALCHLPVVTPYRSPVACSAFHLYVVTLAADLDAVKRLAVFQHLRDRGIGVNVHYIPVHTQPYYQVMGFKPADFPHAQSYYQRALTLPLYPTLREEEQVQVVRALQEVLL